MSLVFYFMLNFVKINIIINQKYIKGSKTIIKNSFLTRIVHKKGMRLKMKIKELRLLNLTIKQDGNTIYEGKTEDVPDNLKEQNYQNIYFEGVNVIIEI